MASNENGLGNDPHSPNLPLGRGMNEEPMDDYGERLDKDSRIAHLMERLIESQERTRKAEEELDSTAMSHLDMMKKTLDDSDRVRNASKRRLEESEKERDKLKESFENEKEEIHNEIKETKKREAKLEKENQDLQDQVKSLHSSLAQARFKLEESDSKAAKLEKELVDQRSRSDKEEMRLNDLIKKLEKELMDTNKDLLDQMGRSDKEETRLKELIKKIEKELMDTQSKAGKLKVKKKQLKKDLEEMEKINGLLASTPSRKINDELIVARQRIDDLEKEVEVVTPKASNVEAKKRKRTESPETNVTIIRKGDGPFPKTPQCIMCEANPKTPGGYIAHLYNHHKSTLKKNGIAYLKCGCDLKVFTYQDAYHKDCDHLEFSIHKMDEK